MMCADIMDLPNTLKVFEKNGIDYLHIDIMDGVFVPNFSLGTDYCRILKKNTDIPLDIHLMVDKPEEKLTMFDFGENDIVSVHVESTNHLQRVLSAIRERGALAFAALNPATPLCMIENVLDVLDGVLVMTVNPGFAGQKLVESALHKISRLHDLLCETGYKNIQIEVDGNVNFENAVKMKAAGAGIFVGGTSSIFKKDRPLEENINLLRNI